DGLSGASLASVPLGRIAEERYGAPYLTLHRADLQASLLAACRAEGAIELRRGFDVSETEVLAETLIVRDADGTPVEGSILVAADGLWSRLRIRIAPDADLRFSGATAWRALVPREEVPAPFDAPE